MIESGEKREEYREIKPYWTKRLNFDIYHTRHFDAIEFVNVYGKNRPRFTVYLYAITIGKAKQEWVGEDYKGEDVYILHLGTKIQGSTI